MPGQAYVTIHITKIYNGKMLLILLPEMSFPVMTNPFKKQILARLPLRDYQDCIDLTENTSAVILKNNYRAS